MVQSSKKISDEQIETLVVKEIYDGKSEGVQTSNAKLSKDDLRPKEYLKHDKFLKPTERLNIEEFPNHNKSEKKQNDKYQHDMDRYHDKYQHDIDRYRDKYQHDIDRYHDKYHRDMDKDEIIRYLSEHIEDNQPTQTSLSDSLKWPIISLSIFIIIVMLIYFFILKDPYGNETNNDEEYERILKKHKLFKHSVLKSKEPKQELITENSTKEENKGKDPTSIDPAKTQIPSAPSVHTAPPVPKQQISEQKIKYPAAFNPDTISAAYC